MNGFQNDQNLTQALNILKSEFSISDSYLFGSRASSSHSSSSDYDIVLVVNQSDQNELDRRIKARTLLKDLDSSFDIFIYTQREFEEYKNDFGSIAETAFNTGIKLDFI